MALTWNQIKMMAVYRVRFASRIYGLLHSPDYRSRYADNLGKEFPRIPAVKILGFSLKPSYAGSQYHHVRQVFIQRPSDLVTSG